MHMLVVICNCLMFFCAVTWLQLDLVSSASQVIGWKDRVFFGWEDYHTICHMTFEPATPLMFLNVNLRLVFLTLPMLPSHVSSPRLRITF